MKAMTSGENSGAYAGHYTLPTAVGTKVAKHKRNVENEEIRAHLSKLKELVPCMPKNRRLSKLEVIQYVIDYICDLQNALETHPSVSSASAAVHSAAAAAVMLSSAAAAAAAAVAAVATGAGVNVQTLSGGDATSPQHRQPLGVLVSNCNTNTSSNISLNRINHEDNDDEGGDSTQV